MSGDPLRRGSLANLAGAAVGGASTLGLVLVTARVLSPADAGRVFAATSAVLVAGAVLRAGTPTAVVLFVSRIDRPGAHPRAVRAVARHGVLPVVTVSALVGVVALLAAGPLGRALGVPAAAVVVLALALPAVAVLDTVLAVARGRDEMGPTVVVDRVGRPVAQVVLTAVAALSPSVTTVVLAWCMPWVAAVLAAVVLVRPARRPPPVAEPERLLDRRAFGRFVLARGVVGVVQVCLARADIVLVAALAGPAEASLYTVASRFVVVVQMAQQAVGSASEPAFGRALGRGDRAAARATLRRTTGWLLRALWPFLVLVAASAPWWLQVVGPEYGDALPVVLVLSAAMAVAVACGLAETVVTMAGRASTLVAGNVVALATMVLLDLRLVPDHGAAGAAVGWGAAIVLKNVVARVLTRRVLHEPAVERPTGARRVEAAC